MLFLWFEVLAAREDLPDEEQVVGYCTLSQLLHYLDRRIDGRYIDI